MTKIRHLYLWVIAVCVVFIYSAFTMLDPDFGWHIRMGDIITNLGIPSTDPLSYTMASFPLIDHEWFTNLTLFHFYGAFGKAGLSILFSVIAILTILFSMDFVSQWKKANKIQKAILLSLFLLVSSSVLAYFGIRPQVLSWLFLSIAYYITKNDKHWKSYRYLLFLLGVVWVNMHGSFPLIVVITIFYTLGKSVKNKNVYREGIFITLFLILLMSVVSPYGVRVWREPLQQVTNTSVRWTISEWLPSIFVGNFPYWFLVTLSVVLVAKYYRKLSIFELITYLFFLFQSVSSTRHVPLWLIITAPILIKLLDVFVESYSTFEFGKERLMIVSKYFLYVAVSLSVYSIGSDLISKYNVREQNFYPKLAVEYLKSNPQDGRIFSKYGWGGYLNWKYPQKKVFIDGRMATWKWDNNPPDESGYIMGEYVDAGRGKIEYIDLFNKYDVKIVLIGAQKDQNYVDSVLSKVTHEVYNIFTDNELTLVSLSKLLNESGSWERIYTDQTSVIYIRK